MDVAAPGPARPRRVLSLGEAKWHQTMTTGHVTRLRRAAALLATRGYDTADTRLTCYSGAGFDVELREAARSDPRVQLVDLATLYASG